MKKSVIISRILLAVTGTCICLAVYIGICDYKAKQHERIESAIKATNEFVEGTKRPSKPQTYDEAFKILNRNYTNEDFAMFMRAKLVHEQGANIPFERSELYLKWESDYKTMFHQ